MFLPPRLSTGWLRSNWRRKRLRRMTKFGFVSNGKSSLTISKAGWSLGWVSALDFEGRTIWIVDAHRGDGRRFIVHSDEILTAFVELERRALTVTFYLESIHADEQ